MKRYIKSTVVSLFDEDPEVIRSVAMHSADDKVLRKIFNHYSTPNDYDYFYCLDLASNPNTPSDILEQLSNFRYDSRIRAKVAENPNTPIETLYGLTRFSYDDILRGLAKNANTPSDLLSKLAKDRDDWVCAYVAGNPNTSKDDLVTLSTHTSPDVRYAVIKNRNIPREVVETLADDPNYSVKKLASALLGWYDRLDQAINKISEN